MKAILIRIGIDQESGCWNAPVDADGEFVYVPIPESAGIRFHPGLERRYNEVLPALHRFCSDRGCRLYSDLGFPEDLLDYPMHLDPDFECMTYGDRGSRRGTEMVDMTEGDLIVFYGGFRPMYRTKQRLVYALMGMYVVREIVPVTDVAVDRWYENAHVRKTKPGSTDVIARAKPALSGRFERCIPIGEWRNGAYRVRPEILEEWGGLSVKGGYIQRSGVPPLFNEPRKFLAWLKKHNVRLLSRNN